MTTIVNFSHKTYTLLYLYFSSVLNDFSSFYGMAVLGKRIDLSYIKRNWRKSPQKTIIKIPPKSFIYFQSLYNYLFIMYNVRVPSILTSSIIKRYFSRQSILICLSTYKSIELDILILSRSLLEVIYKILLEKWHVVQIVILLIPTTVVPKVAITSKRYNIPLFANSSVIASMIRDFPVPPSPLIN